jgi:hypothetical protein
MPNRSYSPEELIRHASLTLSDLEQINRCRRDYNRLGFAYQIGFVRLLNQFPTPNYKSQRVPSINMRSVSRPSHNIKFRF